MSSAAIDLTLDRMEQLEAVHRWSDTALMMYGIDSEMGFRRSAELAWGFALDYKGFREGQ